MADRGRDESARERAARLRRAAELLGDLEPGSSRDETEEGWGDARPGDGSRDDELRRNVPPHHS